ncbi:MAG TPA: trypsin-like peptidase domain-containing protein [Vicinamibacterales bacterium]|nr:trypsin-like peptidase domain-containing protein [Vicinamibacterales bacterium]
MADGAASRRDFFEESRRRSGPMIALLMLLAISGAAYWMLLRPTAATESAASAATEEAPAGTPATGATPQSAEARAWNAAATAKPLAPADTTDTSRLPPPPLAPAGSIEEMVDGALPAVVLIETTSGRGSGFYIAHDTLITNVHVVQNDGYVTVRRSDGSSANARVAAKAPAYDIAVLKVAQPSPTQTVLPMGHARGLRPGQEIVVIGSALGTLQNSVSRGIVSAIRSAGGATLVQTDAAVNPGNSGGPMLDRNGAVIGITTMGYRNAEGLNFGVAIEHARDLVEGRPMDLGTQTGLSAIQTQSESRQTESDRRQQQGEEQLRGRVAQLAQAATRLDAGWARFRQQCYKTAIRGTYDREWFVVLVPGALPGDAAAGCISFFGPLDSEIKQFRELMRASIGDARRANVLPGTIRDVLRANDLDFDWER